MKECQMITINKPWGKEEILETNPKYTVKRITMNPGCQCSLQYHEYKCETIIVISSELTITYGFDKDLLLVKSFQPGDAITLVPHEIHRMSCNATDPAIYIEASTSELIDVIRIEDDYGRK